MTKVGVFGGIPSELTSEVTTSERSNGDKLGRGKIVGAALNTAKILRFLSRQRAPVNLNILSKELGLVPSNALNILQTLVQEDFVSFEPTTKRYAIGFGILDLARGTSLTGGDVAHLLPILENVAYSHGVTVMLWRRITVDQMVLVLAAYSQADVRLHMNVGHRLPLLAGGTGRVMAAYSGLSLSQLKQQFDDAYGSRALSFTQFHKQMKHVTEKGWGLDYGLKSYITGAASLAVPVFGPDGRFRLACAAATFASGFDRNTTVRLAHSLRESSYALTGGLGQY